MTHASRMTFTVGERVRFLDEPGTVIQAGIAPLVQFDEDAISDVKQVAWYALKRIPQPTPEAWRLLFRAHRDGWELVTKCRYSSGEYYRLWHNAKTGATHAVSYPRPVR